MGIDPFEFRAINAVEEGDISVSGAKLPRNGLRETMQAVKDRMGLPKKLGDARGVGIAMGEWRSGSGPSTAYISRGVTIQSTVMSVDICIEPSADLFHGPRLAADPAEVAHLIGAATPPPPAPSSAVCLRLESARH